MDDQDQGEDVVEESCDETDSNVQEVIGLLLTPGMEMQEDAGSDDNGGVVNEDGSSQDVSCELEGAEVASAVATLGLSQDADACGLGVKLEDGSTAYLQGFDPKLLGSTHALTLEDGTTAYIHSSTRESLEGLQAVQLEDGTTAYIQTTGTAEELFGADVAETAIGLDALAAQASNNGSQEEDSASQIRNVSVASGSPSTLTLGKAFQCTYDGCGKLYTTPHHLKVHERTHTGDRPFKCQVSGCGKSFVTGYGLKSHTRVHTGETPYRCTHDHCTKTFKTSGDLQKHVRTHTGERPFKCPFEGCNGAFTTSNIRKVHMRTHTGERPYVCKEDGCGRAFASATNYKNHIRIHTGEKPYVCLVASCGKRFTEYSSLYKHNVVHTHSKPYLCSLCGKNYRQTSTLAMHKRTSHGILVHDPNLGVGEDEDMEEELDEAEGEEEEEPSERRPSKRAPQSIVTTSTVGGTTTTTTLVLQQAGSTSAETLLALQAEHGITFDPQALQEEGTLVQTSSGQQILLVTNPAQVMALQQLAIQQMEQQQALELDTGAESVLGEDVIITASAAPDDD
ncbi:unnamed protein product [Ixodes hexagonus]